MPQIQVPGSVYQRESGRWTAVTPEVLDESQARRRRIRLGTFDTRQAAIDALATFHQEEGHSALLVADIRRMRLSDYLAEWLKLVEAQVEMGHLARRTYSGHEEAVRLHIVPALGEVRVVDLNHLVVYRWLVGLRRAKGPAHWTVSRIYRSLHRALAMRSLFVDEGEWEALVDAAADGRGRDR